MSRDPHLAALLDKAFVAQMLEAVAKVNDHLPELRAHREREAAKSEPAGVRIAS